MKKNVRACEQFLKGFRAAWVIVIECDGALVAIGGKKISGFASNKRRSPSSGLIANARALDFDDVGAQIAEQHGAVGAGKSFGQLDNANAIENGVHGREYN